MKNNASKLNPNRNYIILGIIIFFLALISYVIYSQFLRDDNVHSIPIFNTPVFTKIVNTNPNQLEKCENDVPDDPGNVNLLNNIRDKTMESNLNNKQVFNVSNNIFTYDDAKAICKANGAELASYEQVLDAYKKGAEWCNYGWSKGQMALYPTQKDTWEALQEDPESANSCGEWGVNGGYFDNPNTLFGANCYGIKPKPKDREKVKKLAFSNKQKVMLDKINMYKNQLNEMTVSPFNKNLWSENGKTF